MELNTPTMTISKQNSLTNYKTVLRQMTFYTYNHKH